MRKRRKRKKRRERGKKGKDKEGDYCKIRNLYLKDINRLKFMFKRLID